MKTGTKAPKTDHARKRRAVLGTVDELPPGSRLKIEIGKAVVAVFNVEGEYFAIFGRCPHQSAPLSRGRLQGTVICNAGTNWTTEWAYDGEVVVCPGHAMEFNVKTGEAFGYAMRLRTYEVVVEDGNVILLY